MAAVLTGQLERLASQNRHQLVGQLANLDFWLAEVRHCRATIDGYKQRFERLKKAQTAFVDTHQIRVIDPYIPLEGPPRPPQRVCHHDLELARQELLDAAYRFIARCHREGLLSETEFRRSAESIGTSIDLADLCRRIDSSR